MNKAQNDTKRHPHSLTGTSPSHAVSERLLWKMKFTWKKAARLFSPRRPASRGLTDAGLALASAHTHLGEKYCRGPMLHKGDSYNDAYFPEDFAGLNKSTQGGGWVSPGKRKHSHTSFLFICYYDVSEGYWTKQHNNWSSEDQKTKKGLDLKRYNASKNVSENKDHAA